MLNYNCFSISRINPRKCQPEDLLLWHFYLSDISINRLLHVPSIPHRPEYHNTYDVKVACVLFTARGKDQIG